MRPLIRKWHQSSAWDRVRSVDAVCSSFGGAGSPLAFGEITIHITTKVTQMDNELELQNTLQDLPPVNSFTPDGVGRELLVQIDEFLAEINTLRDQNRGLTPELVKRIEDQFLTDRVRHSATTEGSTLDRRETLHVLTTGQIIEGKRRPSEEVRNLGGSETRRRTHRRGHGTRDRHSQHSQLFAEGLGP